MSNNTTTPTLEEINEILVELEQYRERLINDMTEAAKKAKITKSTMMQHIEPEVQDIDAKIAGLHQLKAQIAG
jgi:archaellum component FlaC